jgi:uroporphyrinogen-III decarboxylase
VLELSRLHGTKLASLVFAPTSCCGPFSLAVGLRGYRNLLKDIRRDPLFVHELLRFSSEVVVTFGRKLRDTHNASPTLQEAWSCLPNVSPEIFHEFCLPYIARCVEALRNPATGSTGTVFYGWGTSLAPDWRGFLRTVCAMGMSALPLTEEEVVGQRGYKQIELAEFKRITASHRVVLMTFLHTDTIMDGPPERIRGLVQDWFRICGPGSGYTASTTLPIGAPAENVRAFVDAFRSCTYPVAGLGEAL